MAGKKTHSHSIHMTDELYALVKKRITLGRFASLNAYFESLVQRETEFLAKGPCEECKVAMALHTLLAVAAPKKRNKR
jgi:hypothetical protein